MEHGRCDRQSEGRQSCVDQSSELAAGQKRVAESIGQRARNLDWKQWLGSTPGRGRIGQSPSFKMARLLQWGSGPHLARWAPFDGLTYVAARADHAGLDRDDGRRMTDMPGAGDCRESSSSPRCRDATWRYLVRGEKRRKKAYLPDFRGDRLKEAFGKPDCHRLRRRLETSAPKA